MSSITSPLNRIGSLGTEGEDLTREGRGRASSRSVQIDPLKDSWKNVAAGSVVPLGVAGAAAFATYVTTYERVAITAWIAVAVVGSASVIAAASASRHRSVEVDRSRHGRPTDAGRRESRAPLEAEVADSDSFKTPSHQQL